MIRKKQLLVMALGSLGAILAAVSSTSVAEAEESPYCKKVHARATGDAALLFSPTLQAQGVKFPKNGAIDTSATVGNSYQFRAALSWSPLDFYKGFRVMDVGDADCREHEVVVTTEEVLSHGPDYARLPALRAQKQYLESKRPFMRDVRAKIDERQAAGVMTLMDAEDARGKLREFDRKAETLQGEIERLESRGVGAHAPLLSALVEQVSARALERDAEMARVRKLDPWTFSITGGIVPQYDPVDFFGLVQVGYNFGGISRVRQENNYLEARGQELRTARYEVSERVRRFREELRLTEAQNSRELSVLTRDAAALTLAKNTLAKSEATNAQPAVDALELMLIGVESERVFLTQFSSELRRMEEK
jgi:hypothetical protein